MTAREDAVRWLRELEDGATRYTTPAGTSGARMVWRKWGQGRPLVLIHGGAGSWMHWARNIPALSRRYSVWVPDMPGFGDSDRPEDTHDADTVAPHLLAGMLEMVGNENFDLVGFSFGGLVSAMVAANAPVTLDRLVLVSVAGMGITDRPTDLKSLRGIVDPDERAAILRFNLNAMMLHDVDAIDDMALYIQETNVPRDRLKNREQVRRNLLPGILQQCRCRTYGVWGTEDVLYRQNIPRLRARVEDLGLRDWAFIEGVGHWMQYERPAEFGAILDRFLKAE